MRSRLRVTLRSSDWRKLSTLLSRPVVAAELPLAAAGAERAGDLRREAPPDLAPLRLRAVLLVLLDFELRLAAGFFALDFALEDFFALDFALEAFARVPVADFFALDLALADFARLAVPFLALEDFALVLFAPLRVLALLVPDFLAPVLFELLRAPDFCVAIPSSSCCRDWRDGLFHYRASKVP
jgi:hypothetical protein